MWRVCITGLGLHYFIFPFGLLYSSCASIHLSPRYSYSLTLNARIPLNWLSVMTFSLHNFETMKHFDSLCFLISMLMLLRIPVFSAFLLLLWDGSLLVVFPRIPDVLISKTLFHQAFVFVDISIFFHFHKASLPENMGTTMTSWARRPPLSLHWCWILLFAFSSAHSRVI